MAKRIFVSYNFNDRDVVEQVRHLIQDHKEEIHGKVVFVENDVSYNGATAVNWELDHVMDGCEAALFVLGEGPHNSPWLNMEVEHALKMKIPILATRLPGEDSGPSSALTPENCTLFNWESGALYQAMNKA